MKSQLWVPALALSISACGGSNAPDTDQTLKTTVNDSQGGSGGSTADTGGGAMNEGGSSVGGQGGSGGQPAPICSPGSSQCSGLDAQTCKSDGSAWETTATCQFLCEGGACTGSCLPGGSQCSGLDVQTCDAAGKWDTTSTCPFVCDTGSCGGVCSPSDKQCNGSTPQTCDSQGKWTDGNTCQFVCSAGSCAGACTPNAIECNGSTVRTCDAQGAWQDTQLCPYVCQAGSCGGVCVPGAAECSGNTVKTCNVNGLWTAGSSCPYICQAGACTGVCTPGEKRCDGTGVQTCDSNAQWTTTAACPGDVHADATCSGAGICGTTCQIGFENCTMEPGCESDLSDPATCGSCNNACNTSGGTATCSSGTCGIDCDTTHADCSGGAADGCETDLGTTSNCQGCGDDCAPPAHAAGICTGSGCDYVCTGLWDDCANGAVDGCEHDVSNDPENCGGCGINCYGGGCFAGVCEYDIERVVGSPTTISSFDLDASHIYWGISGTNGGIYKATKAGSGVQTLVASYPQHNTSWIQSDGVDVFWAGFDGNANTDALSSVSVLGGAPTLLKGSIQGQHIATDGQHVYWTDQRGATPCFCSTPKETNIYRIPVKGGAIEKWATIPFASRHGIKVDDQNVYIASHGPYNSAADDYAGRMYKIHKVAQTPSILASCAPTKNNPTGCYPLSYPMGDFTFNSTHVFFVARPDDTTDTLFRVPIGGGAKERIAQLSTTSHIAADDSHVYTTRSGSVSRVPVNTGAFEFLAKNQKATGSLRIDDTHVYWKSSGYRFTTDYSIMRAPK